MVNPDVGQSVGAGPLRGAVRVRGRGWSSPASFFWGQRPAFWAASWKTWATRSVSAAAAPGTRADLAAQGALRVLDDEGDAKAVLQSGTCEIGVPVKEK